MFQDLVKKLLHIDPHQRPTACQVLLSPWIMNRDKLPTHQIQLQESYKIKVIQMIAYVFTVVFMKMFYFGFRGQWKQLTEQLVSHHQPLI